MRNLILAVVVVGALLGLAVVQYHFLRVAVQLEKVRFDKRAGQTMQAIAGQLERDATFREGLSRLKVAHYTGNRHEAQRLTDTLGGVARQLIDSVLASEGLTARYSFAIKGRLLMYPAIEGAGFKAAQEEDYRTYSHLLGETLREACYCDLFLYWQVNNLLPLLMKRLYWLLLPLAAFLLLLLAALLFMLRTLSQLRKLDQVKNDFINNLTHELKTPAFSISLLLKLLQQSITSGKQQKSIEYLTLLRGENEQLKGHIQKVLELASMETARYELDLKEVELHPLLEDIIRRYRHKAESKGGTLSFAPAPGQPRLMADKGYLRSAIQNLLDNALLYGGTPLRASVSARIRDGAIMIAVSDNGPGIAPRHQRLVFRKFYRISSGDIHKTKGFGLGLSLTRQVARAHGGEVRVSSQDGAGSTFTLVLPAMNP